MHVFFLKRLLQICQETNTNNLLKIWIKFKNKLTPLINNTNIIVKLLVNQSISSVNYNDNKYLLI